MKRCILNTINNQGFLVWMNRSFKFEGHMQNSAVFAQQLPMNNVSGWTWMWCVCNLLSNFRKFYTPMNSNNSGDILVCISIFFLATVGDDKIFLAVIFQSLFSIFIFCLSVSAVRCDFFFLLLIIIFVCEILICLADRFWDVGWNKRHRRDGIK